MKAMIDLIPFVFFYIAYQFYGFYAATGAIIIACSIQSLILFCINRRLERLQVIVLALIWVFGGVTLLLHNPIYLQYKVSVLYWIMSLVFFYTQFFSKEKALSYVLKDHLTLPASAWKALNLSWAVFFLLMGSLNLYVVYHFSMNFWVNFKMFGTLAITFIFVLAQSFYIAKHTDLSDSSKQETSS